jgi:hypothetical protein
MGFLKGAEVLRKRQDTRNRIAALADFFDGRWAGFENSSVSGQMTNLNWLRTNKRG